MSLGAQFYIFVKKKKKKEKEKMGPMFFSRII